jgi:REP element-mobilizing transposase RayT
MARLVIPGLPHHVTQRGNRGQQTFFNDGDYAAYLELMAEWCREEGVEIWSYCLMPNHVHLIAVPKTTEDGLRRAIGEAHRRYTRRVNSREQWRGYLWQGRPAGQRCTALGDGERLESLLENRNTGGGPSRLARTRANGSAAGESGVLGSPGKPCWSRLDAAEARPKTQAQTTQATNEKSREIGIMSTEYPPVFHHCAPGGGSSDVLAFPRKPGRIGVPTGGS